MNFKYCVVARGGLEPPTQGFSVSVSQNPQKLDAFEDWILIDAVLISNGQQLSAQR